MESECMYVVRACGCALCVLAGDLRFFFFFFALLCVRLCVHIHCVLI